MPRPPRHGQTAAGRIVRVLRYLSDHGGAADSTEIRRGVPGYAGDSGHRMWRRDVAELRRRGLVAPHPDGDRNSSRVELLPMVKPESLFLTLEEHAAVTRVGDQLGDAAPVPSPLEAAAPAELSDLARLTRYLEERPGVTMTYRTVQRALGFGEARLTELLRQVVDLDEPTFSSGGWHPGLDWIDYLPPDEEDPQGCISTPAAVLGTVLRRTLHPGRGTGQLGFFAYSAAETDDRLRLIDAALRRLPLTEAERTPLVRARGKLDEWRRRLPDDAGLSYPS